MRRSLPPPLAATSASSRWPDAHTRTPRHWLRSGPPRLVGDDGKAIDFLYYLGDSGKAYGWSDTNPTEWFNANDGTHMTPAGYAAKQKWMVEEAYAFSLTR